MRGVLFAPCLILLARDAKRNQAIFLDLFRRHDLSGWAKALWAIAIVLLPLLGMLIYFITRPPTEEERQATREDAEVSRSASVAEQLTLLSKLKKKGELTEAEYQQEKDRLLAS